MQVSKDRLRERLLSLMEEQRRKGNTEGRAAQIDLLQEILWGDFEGGDRRGVPRHMLRDMR